MYLHVNMYASHIHMCIHLHIAYIHTNKYYVNTHLYIYMYMCLYLYITYTHTYPAFEASSIEESGVMMMPGANDMPRRATVGEEYSSGLIFQSRYWRRPKSMCVICISIYIYMYICTCMYIYICISTYKHINVYM